MRSLMLVCLVGLGVGLGACTPTPAETARAAQAAQATQIRLDKALSGLTRGATSSCIPIGYENSQIAAYGPTILYKVGRGLVYRTDTAGGCENIARGDILVSKQVQGRPCSGDIATTVDRTSGTVTGSCSFGDFTAYRRP